MSHRKITVGKFSRFKIGALGVATVASMGGLIAVGAAPAEASSTITFTYTGAAQSWTVPAGVTSATFDVYGAHGGGALFTSGLPGGSGAHVTSTIAVTPGELVVIYVGGNGGDYGNTNSFNGGIGGFNGGGSGPGGTFTGTGYGFGGGGASDIRTGCSSVATCGLDHRVIVAGGGGGAGGGAGGSYGPGGNAAMPGSDGGLFTRSDFGSNTPNGGFGGGAGTDSGPGLNGGSASCTGVCIPGGAGGDGVLATGGHGGLAPFFLGNGGGNGGGGGGGWYGGAGGGGGAMAFKTEGCNCGFNGGGAGGGGGSSHAPAGATYELHNSAPRVVISYEEAPTYGWAGFFDPVDNDALNVIQAGRSVPLKFRVTGAGGVPVSGLTTVTVTSKKVDCDTAAADDTQVVEPATGSSGLQDQGDGYYQFNWASAKTYAGQCRAVTVDLGDGVAHTALFRFKK